MIASHHLSENAADCDVVGWTVKASHDSLDTKSQRNQNGYLLSTKAIR